MYIATDAFRFIGINSFQFNFKLLIHMVSCSQTSDWTYASILEAGHTLRHVNK